MLSEIPYTDGLSITKLLAFIKYLLQIKDLQQLSDCQILQVLLPKSRPPLKDRVLESLSSQHPVEELHTTLIRHFIPTGIYEELKRNTVFRVQGAHERLAHYIADIREASRLLQVNWSEKQLVETILVGLSPEERSRLALINKPNTFAELEQCSIHSSNVWYSDQNRRSLLPQVQRINETQPLVPDTRTHRESRPFRIPATSHYQTKSNNQQPQQNTSDTVSREKRCYNCGKLGHISRSVSYTHLDVYKRQVL